MRIMILARGGVVSLGKDKVGTDPGSAYFISELARLAESVEVCGHIRPASTSFHQEISGKRLQITLLGHSSRGGYASPTTARKLVEAMRRADYLYLFTGTLAVYASWLNRFLARRPYAVYEQPWMDDAYLASYLPRVSFPARWLYAPVMRQLRRQMILGAAHVYVHGKKLYEECVRFGHRRVSEVVPLTNLRAEHFHLRQVVSKDRPLRILYVGGVGPAKGLDVLLEALQLLNQEGTDFSVTLAVKVPLTSFQEAELEKLPENRSLRVLVGKPLHPDLIDRYRLADVLVVPSFSEGFPRVIYEGGSQSIALVATQVGSIPDLLRNDHDGILIPSGNPAALAYAIRSLSLQRDRALRLGRNLYQTVWKKLFQSSPYRSHAEQVYENATELLTGKNSSA